MTKRYKFLNISPILKIKSFLLLMMLVSLGSSSFMFAQNTNPGLDPVLTLSSTKVTLFSAANSTQDVTVTSNIAWTVSNYPAWLAVNPVSGSGNGTITFTAQENLGAKRVANVIVSAIGVADQIITVTQLPETPSFYFTSSSSGALSISLQFNSSGSFYIDWGDGTQILKSASMTLTDYTSPAYVSGKIVKIYGIGITDITINSQNLATLDVTQCLDLTTLDVQHNNLNALDLSNNTKLTSLVLAYNKLSALNINNNILLNNLSVSYNNLSALDVSSNPNLTYLSCSSNKINSLDVSRNTALNKLYCSSNKLTSLDVTNNTSLTLLYCSNNDMGFNTLPQLKSVYTAYNYSPQNLYPLSANGNIVDLRNQYSVPDINSILRNTVYKWYTKTAGTLLVAGTDYTEANGLFTFQKILSDSVYCIMTNAAFPSLIGVNALRTVNLKVELLLPIVTTTAVNPLDVTPTTALVNGKIVDLGIPVATEYGICWNTTGLPDPTVTGDKHNLGLPMGGDFTDNNFTGLIPNTTYYVRAYATNLAGTGYGVVRTFTTNGVLPSVTTDLIAQIGIAKATVSGNITDLGAPNPTEYGVVWSTLPTPTVALLTKTSQGPATLTGPFSNDITGLTATTTYYVRAYATNTVGTSYGLEQVFTTLTPSINISNPVPATLSRFSTTVGTASDSKTFVVGGSLSQDLVITAPTNFEVRENGIGTFGPSVSFTPSSSEIVTDKTIEVRIASTAPLGSVSGNVDCSSTGAITRSVAVDGTVKPIQLTIPDPTVTLSKSYDGTTQAGFIVGALTPILPGDDVSLDATTTTATYPDANVGINKTITVHYTLTGAQANKYIAPADYVITTGEITGKPLTASNPTITTPRVYDATPVAAVTPGTLTGVLAADVANVTLEATASYDNANAGTGKIITVAYTLSGSAAGNYIAPSNYVIITGEITGKQLTVSDPMLTLSKEYNGNTLASVIAGTLSGVEMSDMANVTVGATASYDNANAGTGKTITVVYSLSGSALGNYLDPVNYIATNGEITGKPLTASDPSIALSKPYDGNTLVSVTPGTLTGVLPVDLAGVTLEATASYDNANAGPGKTITVTYTLSGSEAYKYLAPADFVITTGVITGKPLTASNPTITISRAYDGTPGAAVTPGTLTGVEAADVANVTLEATASYDNANAGANKTITVVYSLSGSAAGNYIAPSNYVIITGEITGKQLTVSDPMLTLSKEYNGNTLASVIAGTLSGVEMSDMANVTVGATASYDNANAGTGKTITVVYSLLGSALGNYLAPVNYIVTNGEITGKPLTASDPAITTSKPYDGNNLAAVTPGTLTGVLAADLAGVTLGATASYDTANAGSGKTITVTYTLSGSEAYKYLAPADFVITTGEITGKPLTASVPTITTLRAYDGTPGAAVTPGTLTGVEAADVVNVTLEATASYDNANAGANKTITVAYTLSGSAAGNYTAPSNYVITTGEITGKQLTVSDPTLEVKKVYDGNPIATVTPGTLSGVELPDMANVIVAATASYDNSNAGTGKTITVVYSLSGSALGNYLDPVNYIATNGEITGKPLTASDPSIALSKPYDGNTLVSVTPGTLTGVLAADLAGVTLGATASYDTANAGSGKTITVTYTLSGSEAYKYLAPADYVITTGEITGKPLTASNPTITTPRVYDGTPVAAVVPGTLTGVLAADLANVTLEATASYDNANVGVNKTITVVYSLSGSAAGNYIAPSNYVIITGEITGKQLTVSDPLLTLSKEYNGDTFASVTPGVLFGVEAADMATVIVGATASYDNANAGTGKTITVIYSLSGSAAGNYLVPINYIATNGEITGKPLTASAPAITTSKIYNGNALAAVIPGTLSGVEATDVGNVVLSASASYDNLSVGTGKTITVTYTLSGSEAYKYLAPVDYIITTGEITGKPLTTSVPAIITSKEYNGTLTAAVTPGTLTGIDSGDDVILNATATYDNATVGTGKTITVTYMLTGLSANTYATPADYIINTGEITVKPLTASIPTIDVSKMYDGSSVATVLPGTLTGVEAVDLATVFLEATASYDNANVGSGKTITVVYTLSGSTAGNYSVPLNYTATNGEITVKPLIASDPIITTMKVYDGSLTATVAPGTLSGVEPVDIGNVALLASASYDNINVGTGKTITVTYVLTGSASGNYAAPLMYVVTNGEIDGKPLIPSTPIITTLKEYDGTPAANVAPQTLTGVDPGDDVILTATATYDNSNAGTGKTITVNYTLTGLSASIYAVPADYTVNSGEIDPKPLTVNVPAVTTLKIYDGTPVADVIAGTLSGVEAGDITNVLLSAVATYDNANIGVGKAITVTYTLTGSASANYIAPSDYILPNGEITVKALTVSDPIITAAKVYDGSVMATVTPGTLSGVEVVDAANVVLTAAATYDNANTGSGKTITVTYALNGSAAGNYTVPSDFVILTAEITPKPLTVSDPTITTNKVYDGNLAADFTIGTLSGVEPGDAANVVLNAAATYDNINVGTGKTITVKYTLTGSASGNYLAPLDYILQTGEIAGMPLTITPPTLTTLKVYNGSPVANVTPGSLLGVNPGDDVSVNAIATYNNANIGSGKTITVTYSLSGANAPIYAAPSNEVFTNGEIDAKILTATNAAVTSSKVYDGNTTAIVTPGILTGVEPGDDVILHATATYDNPIPGTGKTITVVYSLTGSSAGNYTTPSNYNVSNGEITVKPLILLNMTVTLVKTYDGSTSITVIPGVLTGVETGDDVALNVIANYDNANVGTGKTITVTFSLSGTNAGNYIAPANYTISTGVINPNTLSVSNPVISTLKEYDGTISVVYTPGSLTGVNIADAPNVILTSTAAYDNANVGTGKTITVTYGLSGSLASNYIAPSNDIVTNGVITPKSVVVVALKITTSKVYDATSSAIFTVDDLSGVLPLDAGNVILAGTATYDNANAGSGKNITVAYTLSGSAAGNYATPSSYTITNGVIKAKQLTIADPVVVTNKMVDGNTSAAITTVGNLQGVEALDGGSVNFMATANYDNPNVGINKTVTVAYTLNGTAMDNYIAPVDFIITGAKISDNVILSPIATPTNGCEGFAVDLAYTVVTGTPTQYKITFDAATLAAGIQDVSYTNLPTASASGILPIDIPAGTKDNIYQGTLQFRNELGVESPVYTFQFTINVSPDYIIPKFDDVVLIDNSSNRFVAYQWYRDGVELKGATKQFYNDLGGLVGSYSAKLTTVDGQTLYTCPKVLEISLVKKVSVFPSPVKKYQASTVKVTGLKDEELAGAELSVYTMQGTCVYHTTEVQKVNTISLPPMVGMYVGHVTTSGGQKLPFKVIVIE